MLMMIRIRRSRETGLSFVRSTPRNVVRAPRDRRFMAFGEADKALIGGTRNAAARDEGWLVGCSFGSNSQVMGGRVVC